VRLLAAGSWRLLGVGPSPRDPRSWAMRRRAVESSAGCGVWGVGQGPRKAFLPGVARRQEGLGRMRCNFTQQNALYTTKRVLTHYTQQNASELILRTLRRLIHCVHFTHLHSLDLFRSESHWNSLCALYAA
jgi:hypothetical protein